MERGALYARRPDWAANAGKAFFGEQSVAGAQRAYGAVGGADYVVEGDWNGGAVIPGREDNVLLAATELVAKVGREGVRVLDLGTGDGHFLLALHERLGIPWANLVGVSAEVEHLQIYRTVL